MTVQQILDNLNKIPENKRHLPAIVIDGRSGESFEVNLYDIRAHEPKSHDAGILCDMDDKAEYCWGSLD